MPLHLLGKKSWNVYNADNIARVQRDEAAAQARQEATEARMQEVDSDRRLAILRGEVPPPLESAEEDDSTMMNDIYARSAGSILRKKRKRHGEDDTDFEIRLAREKASGSAAELAARSNTTPASVLPPAPPSLVDAAGHISLFDQRDERSGPSRGSKNNAAEAEREAAAQKRREYEEQFQMRFTNAAGKGGAGLTDGGPWYAQKHRRQGPRLPSDLAVADINLEKESSSNQRARELGIDAPTTDVWGREDPDRRAREAARQDADDPLVMMKNGAAKVRELERERRSDQVEREGELDQLRREQYRRAKRHRRRRERSEERRHHDARRERDAKERRRPESPHRAKDARSGERDERHGYSRRRNSDGHGHGHTKKHARLSRHGREPPRSSRD